MQWDTVVTYRFVEKCWAGSLTKTPGVTTSVKCVFGCSVWGVISQRVWSVCLWVVSSTEQTNQVAGRQVRAQPVRPDTADCDACAVHARTRPIHCSIATAAADTVHNTQRLSTERRFAKQIHFETRDTRGAQSSPWPSSPDPDCDQSDVQNCLSPRSITFLFVFVCLFVFCLFLCILCIIILLLF